MRCHFIQDRLLELLFYLLLRIIFLSMIMTCLPVTKVSLHFASCWLIWNMQIIFSEYIYCKWCYIWGILNSNRSAIHKNKNEGRNNYNNNFRVNNIT